MAVEDVDAALVQQLSRQDQLATRRSHLGQLQVAHSDADLNAAIDIIVEDKIHWIQKTHFYHYDQMACCLSYRTTFFFGLIYINIF